jgi:general transcription factor 3C polypeptide 5 (transcription factor C subunit 1)
MIGGKRTLVNHSKGQPTKTQYGDWASATVPSHSIVPVFNDKSTIECVEKLKDLFDKRPIWTRRGLRNAMTPRLRNALKYVYPQVSYYWRSGPWRDTCVKFGVDPRSSKDYAIYQVVAFKMEAVKSVKAWKYVIIQRYA